MPRPALCPPQRTAQLAAYFTEHVASPFTVLYQSHPKWPLPPSLSPSSQNKLTISVVDASFNPPSRAHLALLDLYSLQSPLSSLQSTPTTDAQLLLLSVKNADKVGGTDPSLRLEMMRELALDYGHNIAIACCSEPTFVGKSALLKSELDNLIKEKNSDTLIPTSLAFSVGWDTITRVFDEKYYLNGPSLQESMQTFFEKDGSTIICARRGDAEEEECTFVNSLAVSRWAQYFEIVSLPEEMASISSSLIRKTVSEHEGSTDELRKKLSSLVTNGVAEYIVASGLYRL